MGKRATRKSQSGDGIRDLELDALKAENLHLKEEVERLRLRNAGAHPAAALADALQSSDDAGDVADDAMTMFAASMVIRSELVELLDLFKNTIADYERRLDQLTADPIAATGIDDGLVVEDDLGDTDDEDEDAVDDEHETDDEDAVTIDLRDPEKLTAVNGSRRNGSRHNRDRDRDSTPAAKGA